MNSRRCVPDAPAREAPISPSDRRTHLVRWCVGRHRYSRAISSINDLLSVWHSKSYAQKASPVEYSRLILDGEAIINNESQAWQKTIFRQESEKTKKEADEEAAVAAEAKRMAAEKAAALGLLELLEALSLDAGTLCTATAAAVAYCNVYGANSVADLGKRASRLIAHPQVVPSYRYPLGMGPRGPALTHMALQCSCMASGGCAHKRGEVPQLAPHVHMLYTGITWSTGWLHGSLWSPSLQRSLRRRS